MNPTIHVRRRPVWMPSRLSRTLRSIGRGLTVISFRRAAGGLLLLIVLYVSREAFRDELVIDPISVPKSWEEAGLTAEVMADHVGDALREIEAVTETTMQKDNLVRLRDQGALPDIDIPGTKLGLRFLVDVTREIVGIHPAHIRCDIVAPSPPSTASEEVSIAVHLVQGRNVKVTHLTVPARDGTDMIARRSAEAVLRTVNPYLLAVYWERSEPAKATEVARQIIEDPAQDRLHLTAAHDLLGIILSVQKKYVESIPEFERATKLDPKDAKDINNWGSSLIALGKLDDAIPKFRRAIELDPKYASAYSNWGMALQLQRKYDEAISKFQKATELDPKEWLAWNNWAAALLAMGKPDEAIMKVQKAIEIDSHHALAYDNYGAALAAQKKYGEATAKFQMALDLNPGETMAYLNWASALSNQQKYAEAAKKCEQAADISPGVADVYYSWGLALHALKRYSEAIEKYQKAVDINPDYAEVYSGWGVTLHAQARYDDAIARYRKALELNPRFAVAETNWGVALSAQGKYSEAILRYQNAIEINPMASDAYSDWADALRKLGYATEAEAMSAKSREVAVSK